MSTTDTTPDGPVPGGPAPDDPAAVPTPLAPKGIKTGRNLPAAIGVGVVLGGLALLTLLTVKATFLIYMGVALAIGLHELITALKTKGINVPLIPVALGGAAILTTAYWAAGGATAAAFALTVLAILIVRMFGGTNGYVKDVTAGVFATAYLALFGATRRGDAGRAQRRQARPDLHRPHDLQRHRRLFRRHHAHPVHRRPQDGPVISPKKTWEGLAGSALPRVVAGAHPAPDTAAAATGGRASSRASRRWPPPSSVTWPSR